MERAQASTSVVGTVVEVVEAGAAAGVLAGAAMAAWLVVFSLCTGRGLLTPLALVGAIFYGPDAERAGLGAPFWGLVIHLSVSVPLGVLFAAMVHRDTDPFLAEVGGIVYGLLVWGVMTLLVAPVVNPTLRKAISEMWIGWFAAHVPFGGVLGLAPQLRRRFLGGA